MPGRAGTELATARSPLRLRMVLAGFGLLVCVGAGLWAWWSRDVDRTAMPVLALLAALGALVAVVDLAVMIRRRRARR
jgi:hypothetical protein